jgi:hypothetical protein
MNKAALTCPEPATDTTRLLAIIEAMYRDHAAAMERQQQITMAAQKELSEQRELFDRWMNANEGKRGAGSDNRACWALAYGLGSHNNNTKKAFFDDDFVGYDDDIVAMRISKDDDIRKRNGW